MTAPALERLHEHGGIRKGLVVPRVRLAVGDGAGEELARFLYGRGDRRVLCLDSDDQHTVERHRFNARIGEDARVPSHPAAVGDDLIRDVVQHRSGDWQRQILAERGLELVDVNRLRDLEQLRRREPRHVGVGEEFGLPAVLDAFRQVELVDGVAGVDTLLDELVHKRVEGGLHVVSRFRAARRLAVHDRGDEVLRIAAEPARRDMRLDETLVQAQPGRELRDGLVLHRLAGGVASHGNVDERVDGGLAVTEHGGDFVGGLAEVDFGLEAGLPRHELRTDRQLGVLVTWMARLDLREDGQSHGVGREAFERRAAVRGRDLLRREVASLRGCRVAQVFKRILDEPDVEYVRNDARRRHRRLAEDVAETVHCLGESGLELLRELVEIAAEEFVGDIVVERGVHRDDPVHLRLDGHDAARGERLARRILRGAVVLELHDVLDGLRDIGLAAEHGGDGFAEEPAGFVVLFSIGARTPSPVQQAADMVGSGSRNRAPGESVFVAGYAGDRRAGGRVRLLLGELHEFVELRVDRDCHGICLSLLESRCFFAGL